MIKLEPSNTISRSDSRPSICHVLHTLNVGGAEILAKQIAISSGEHFRPVFACLDSLGSLGEQLLEYGFEVEVLDRQPGFDLGCARRLARFLKRENVTLVHAHQYAPFFCSAMARLFNVRYPILFTEHGRDYPDFRRPKRVLANKVLLGHHDRVVAVGDCVKTALVKFEGIPSNRIETIYNGVDAKRFGTNGFLRQRIRSELGLKKNDIAIVQVARLNRLKDFETAVRSISQVCESRPNVKYFIVGEGEEKVSIESLIEQLGLKNNVTLLGLRNDVDQLLEGMDIFLLTSITEGIPLSLIEAMLAKLPCVATMVGGVPEVLKNRETGLTASSGNYGQIADRLKRLIDEPQLREVFGNCGQQRAVEKFNAEQMFDKYLQAYFEMSGSKLGKKPTRSKVPTANH